MKRNEKIADRADISLKTMYFNRYLLIRYILALFFFTNLYWFLSLLLSDSSLFFIPALLLIFIIISTVEQTKILNNHTNNAVYTKNCFKLLFFTNICLIFTVYFDFTFQRLYPFLVDKIASKVSVLFVLLAGILLCFFTLQRLYKIKNNKDKQYKRIKEYEKILKL